MIHDYIRVICSCCGDRFDVPLYCGNRFCPVCCFSRSIRIRNRISWLCSNIELKRSESVKHITFTIPNQVDLAKMIKHLVKSFRKLRHTDLWKKHVSGGAFVVEVTGKPGDWHGHIHSVVQCSYVPWEKLRDSWEKISGGKGVWISRIPIKAAVLYLSKYLSKSSVAESDMFEVSQSLKGMRFFQPFGSWYHMDRKYPKPLKICSECNSGNSFCLAYELIGGYSTVRKLLEIPTKGPPIVLRSNV
jgi:hypothetical protein